MGNPNAPTEHPETLSPTNEKSITIDAKNGTIGHVSAELGISMDFLKKLIGGNQDDNKTLTLVTENYFTPGKGKDKMKEVNWSAVSVGDTYTFRMNSDPKTGGALIRMRNGNVISVLVPPEAINKKSASVEELKKDTQSQLASLMKELESQSA